MSPPKSPPTRVEGMVKGRTCGAPPAARHLLSGCRGIGTRLCRGARTRSRRAQSEQSAETQSQSPQRRSLLFTRLDDTTPCKHRITTQHKTKCVSCSHYHTFSPRQSLVSRVRSACICYTPRTTSAGADAELEMAFNRSPALSLAPDKRFCDAAASMEARELSTACQNQGR